MAMEFDNVVGIALRTRGRLVRLAADTEPTVDDDGGDLQPGTELFIEDTGKLLYWNGSAWKFPSYRQKFDQLIEFQREIRDRLSSLVDEGNDDE